MFNSAIKSLKSTQLRKVVIMKLPFHPRSSIRTFLALLFNETLSNLWIQSPHKNQILLSEGSFRKSDVTRTIIRIANEAMKKEDDEWTHVKTKITRPLTNDTPVFVIPTSNRFNSEGN